LRISYAQKTLALVLSFALIPSVLTSYAIIDTSGSSIMGSAEDTVKGVLDSKETTLEVWFGDQVDLVRAIASVPGFAEDAQAVVDASMGGTPAPGAASRISALLNSTGDPRVSLSQPMLVEAVSGRVVLSPSRQEWNGSTVMNATIIEMCCMGAGVVYLPQMVRSFEPWLLATTPVKDTASGVVIVAILCLGVNNEALSRVLAEPRGLGLTGDVFLVGPDGRLLTTAPGGLGPGDATPSRGAAIAIGGISGEGTYKGSSGNEVVGAYIPIETARLALVVEMDSEDAMAPLTPIVMTAVAAGIIMCIALIYISVAITRALVRDLDSLVKWSGEVGHGNWEARLDLGGTAEAQDLEKAFRQMVRDLGKQQAQLRAAERRYSNLFKSSLDPVFSTRPDWTVIELNAAGERLLGIPRQNDGTYGRTLLSLFADEVERKEFERRLERDGAVAGFEARLSAATGREVYALISATRRLDDSGRLMHMQGVVHDITDRKRFESALIDAKNQAEFYCDIMSHDLNNAIQGLGGYLELASLAQDVDDVNEFLPAAQEQLNRASVLLRNVRRLSRMGSRQVECKPMDAHKIIDYCTRAVTRNHPVDAIRFDLVMPEGPIMVQAEEFLEDVYMNLLDNAVKYDPHDVKVVDVVATRAQAEGHARWQFRFRDRGPGVADRDKRTIFGRFERRALSEYGTGLGLSIVLKAAERCGGTAWVEDRVPGDYTMGACFVVELPEAGATPPPQVPGDAQDGEPPAGQHI
jgi:PAS domain S-box-containing protein